jgi:hypothetical protein
MISLIIFGLLPDPQMPPGYVAPVENGMQNFRILLTLFKDERVFKMYGLFCNSACAAATAQGLLVPFFCLILKHETV